VRLDPDAEAAAITAALRALAPELTAVPMIKTSRPFYGARVGDLRATAAGWRRAHRDARPAEVAELADRRTPASGRSSWRLLPARPGPGAWPPPARRVRA
jgi:hypothetical protein